MDQHYAPDFQVRIQGLTLQADVSQAVAEVSYESSLDTADMFSLQINNAGLRFTDSALFDVGQDVELHMGYAGDLHPMMLGEITAVSPAFPQSGAPMLTVTGYDKSHRLRHNQPSRFTFKHMNDSAIAAQIAAENLLVPVVDPAPMPPRKSVQQTGSDWALLRELAERNFFQVYVRWDRLHFQLPRPQTEMLTLEWGKNLMSFSPRLSTSGQVGIQVVRGYDYKLAQTIVAILPAISLGEDLGDVVERLGNDFVERLVELGRSVVRDPEIDSFVDATVLAKSVLMQILQGLYEGSGQCVGVPTLRAGDMVEIRGVGKRFSGTYRLGKVRHTIGSGGYQTSFEVSQSYNQSLLRSLRQKIAAAPPPDRQERIYGVVVGLVENNVDDEGLGRVQLSFPHLSDLNLSAWARVAAPMAGDDAGAYFLPDVRQEVLVAFEQGDVNRPIVLGGLWNGRARPPETNKGANERKVIKTKGGHSLLFDDTPSTGGIVLNEGQNGAARLNDRVRSTSADDATFWSWLSGLINVFQTWTPVANDGGAVLKTALTTYLTTNPVPSQLTGKIIEGSSNVKVGG